MERIKFKSLLVFACFLAACSSKRTRSDVDSSTAQPKVTEQSDSDSSASEISKGNVSVPLNKTLPRFGFIFSGGGAKTFAHIGVLKELQKMKWPIHAVAGFEWGSVIAATYAENLSANEVEWEMSKLKEFAKTESFLKTVFEKKTTADLKIPFVCPSLNLSKQTYFLLNRGRLDQLIPFCVAQPPLTAVYGQSVAVMSDVAGLAQSLRQTGANRIILVNVLANEGGARAYVKDYTSAENILWVQSAALMAKKPAGVDEMIDINLNDFPINDLDKRRDLIAKGAEISYSQIRKLAAKYGF